MSTETGNMNSADPGLLALVMLLRLHGLGADPEQIRHRFGAGTIGIAEMLRCAKELGLKARVYRTKWSRLATTPFPGIAVRRDGGFLLIGKASADKVLASAAPVISSPRPYGAG
jgi:ATP-binding cassette, subfamily B, bacterial HlyB/CyaB